MRLNKNLQAKFLIYISSTLLLVFIFIGFFIGTKNSENAVNSACEYTQLLADKNAKEVKSIFNQHVGFINTSAKTLSNVIQSNNQLGLEIVGAQIQTTLKENSNIEEAWILISNSLLNDPNLPLNEWSLFQINKINNAGIQRVNDKAQIENYLSKYGQANLTKISDPYNNSNKRLVDIYSPINHGSKKVGYIGCALNLNILSNLIASTNIYEGSSIGILTNSAIFVAHSSPSFDGKEYAQIFSEENKQWEVGKKILKGSSFEIKDESNKKSNYSYFSALKITENNDSWSVMVTMPLNNMITATKKSILLSTSISLLGFLLIILVIYILTKRIVNPIKKVTEVLQLLSKGNLIDIKTSEIKTDDELQEMGDNLNLVVNGLKKTENFALEIGKGKLENEYSLLGDADQIGKALIDMRNSLKKNIEEDKKRKEEDKHIAWASNGIAKFSEILRQDNANMKKLGYNIISNLVKYLNVNQGALFVLNEDNPNDPFFELATAIAYDRDKFMQKKIKIGEGLVGRCAFEKKTIYITEVPASYTTITSGLGDSKPSSILIVPCILNDDVFGIIELSSFVPLKPFEIEFIEKLGESIGSTISSVRINLKTSTLLAASQHQSEELAAQEEELRQNLEEMEATQEDLKRQMQTNAEMQENLSQQNALLDSLLNSLPDYIYFKDLDSKFLRLSSSMLHLFGASSVNDVIGKSDFDFQTPENAKKYFADEQNIIKLQKGITDQIQEEVMPDGTAIWTSVTKLPLMTGDGKCFGTFGISKNVTELKLLEIEAQKQTTLLDALLNSLPDYIYFKDKDSKFLRISKSMIELFGASSVEDVIGKSDFDYHTPENAKLYYDDEQNIMKTRQGLTNHIQKEQTTDGKILWNSVSKLPLLNKDNECVGTFGISKDITQLKQLELESNKQRAELMSIIEAIKNAIYTVEYDLKSIVTDVNEALLKLLKVDRKHYVGIHYKDEITTAKMTDKEFQKFWNDLLNGQIKYLQNTITIDRKEVYFYETYSPIKDQDDEVIKILKMALDITQYIKK